MSKRRTQKEIDEIVAYAMKVGLDRRIADLCRDKYEVEKLFEIQEKMQEHSSVYHNLKIMAPKDKTLEYKRALEHKKALAEYLFNSGQSKSLEVLSRVTVEVNEPGIRDFLTKNKAYITEEAEKLHFSKTRIKELISLMIEYLKDEIEDESMKLPPNSTRLSLSRQMTDQIISAKSDDIDKHLEMKQKKAFYDLEHSEFVKKHST